MAALLLLTLAAVACGEPQPPKPAAPTRDASTKGPARGSVEERESTTLFRVEVVDAQTAFAWGTNDRGFFGSVVIKTSDGGAHWTCVLRTSETELVAVEFLDAQNGAAFSDGGSVYTTTDGGATWAGTSDPSVLAMRHAVLDPKNTGPGQPYATIDGVFFRSEQLGWAFGSRDEVVPDAKPGRINTITRPLVVRTTNGGATWSEVKLAANAPQITLRRGFFVDPQNGWAVGGDIDEDVTGAVLRTTDGGATWSAVTPSAKQIPNDVFFVDANRGWLVGATEDEAGEPGPSEVLTTADGGATWQSQAKVPTSLRSIQFADAQTGWAVGAAGKVYRTTDGGATWVEQTAHDWNGGQVINLTDPIYSGGTPPTFSGFALVAPGHGFAASDLGVYEYKAK